MHLNPISKLKSGTSSTFAFVRNHPIAFVVVGLVFAVYAAPTVRSWLGKLATKFPTVGKVLPSSFIA